MVRGGGGAVVPLFTRTAVACSNFIAWTGNTAVTYSSSGICGWEGIGIGFVSPDWSWLEWCGSGVLV